MKYFFYFILFLFPFFVNGEKKNNASKKKITIFTSWGYNRDYYTHSAIHFKGDDYNFVLKHTVAKDRQSPFSFSTYFDVTHISVPQYNFSIGATLPDHLSISIGLDHMKYVVQQYSATTINGSIHNKTEYNGNYENQPMKITPDFLQFEHTNGLNYLHFKFEKEKEWFAGRIKHVGLKTGAGLNAGILVPRSDVKLMNYAENDKFHLAGYGIGINAGMKAELFRYFFLRLDNKTGFINMPDILTRGIEYKDRAKQYFGFTEFYFSFGFQYRF